jgi:protocatechuate 3,4-dioxygenase beta subunit
MNVRVCRILLIISIAISGFGCEATIQIDGKVTDLQGKPVQGAAIEFSSESAPQRFSTVSDADGRYSASFTTRPAKIKYTLTAKKPGFEDFQREVDYTDEHRDVILMPNPKASKGKERDGS